MCWKRKGREKADVKLIGKGEERRLEIGRMSQTSCCNLEPERFCDVIARCDNGSRSSQGCLGVLRQGKHAIKACESEARYGMDTGFGLEIKGDFNSVGGQTQIKAQVGR
jgi:hypothetical protein